MLEYKIGDLPRITDILYDEDGNLFPMVAGDHVTFTMCIHDKTGALVSTQIDGANAVIDDADESQVGFQFEEALEFTADTDCDAYWNVNDKYTFPGRGFLKIRWGRK